MKNGDAVRVWPRGDESRSAIGRIVLLSENGQAIAIRFGEAYVPFFTAATGMALHPKHGKMLLATRVEEGWEDVFSKNCFEIKESGNSEQ